VRSQTEARQAGSMSTLVGPPRAYTPVNVDLKEGFRVGLGGVKV
jgi:hypothetical protein